MWKDYFSFNKRQRNGIIVLLALILIMMAWLIISNYIAPSKGNIDVSQFKSEVANANKSSTEKAVLGDSNIISENSSKAAVKMSINKCTIKELSHTPNIGYYLAQAIVNYRELHGPYKRIEDLLNNKAIDDSTYAKISPYLKAE
ncbi:MAG TPA: helix-hairpin-helix domain-containing protein [Bacteroidia bacterium]|jgi:competence ComEA-like helix-hairpin-helix protein|nr:helix-hairpin-helix domain-containing protein [Bacteroidia bacterium]